MTEEEMRKVAYGIVLALQNNGYENVELLEFEPGDPLPIGFLRDGESFVLELAPM